MSKPVVAIVGRPNVGKSSLLNSLVEEEKAIVTDVPGTTRDIVEGSLIVSGIPLNIIDTAGIRKTEDTVEKIGVEKSLKIIDTSDLLIYILNNNEEINGILLQSPIPDGLDINEAFRKISPEKDVDGFHPVNVGKLVLGQDTFVSCTPYGVMKMFEEYNIDLEGKNAVVIGRSNIVGKPMSQCLLNKNATVTICHSRTRNLPEITKNADILVSAIGRPEFVTADMVKDGAVVIDVGINRTAEGKLKGDVDFENVSKKASYITPVPGGVGPMTIAMLMNNVVKASKNQAKK